MAKLKMKKIELIALLTDSKKIIELLQRRGIVEISQNSDEELVGTSVSAVVGEFEKFRSGAAQALEILDKYAPEKGSITDIFGGKTEVEVDRFGNAAMKLEDILSSAAEIIKNNRIIAENEASIAQLEVKCDTLRQWEGLDVPLSFKGTAKTTAFIGSVPYAASEAELAEKLDVKCSIEVISSSKEQTNLFVLCMKDNEDAVSDALRGISFAAVSEQENAKPSELTKKYRAESKALSDAAEASKNKIAELASARKGLKFAVDYLQMRKDKYEALELLGFTGKTFVLTGYIPEKYADKLKEEIEKKYTCMIEYSDPTDEDDVPVLLENGSFSSPVEGITKMYAMPSKSDVDPTPVMAFFYYLFFGMMLSDAGYGVLMVIGTIFALKKFKLEEPMRKTLVMFRNCGISTVIWGTLFGSWFGDIIQVVGREYFGKEIGSVALWFEPINDPIKLLLYSFGFGILHLLLGVAVSCKMAWSEGRKLDAVLDTTSIYLTVIGAAPVAASILTDVPQMLIKLGLYMLIAGAVMIVLTSGRSSKSIFGKLFGGLYALYNTATGYLGDILSYSRLLALGLATGSIASVINIMGTMPENMVLKTILLVIIFTVGHIANLAINLLGAYVHTDRLQFVELFSKFYTGGGREFSPLAVNTKYIKFKEEN